MTKTNKEVTRIDKPTKSITRIIKLPNKGDAGYTPVKGKDYFDGVTPSDEKLLSLITPRIPKPIKGDNGKDGKSFTKKEVRDLIDESLGEKMPELMRELEGKGEVTIEELNKGFNIVSKGKKYYVGGDVVGPKLRLLVQMGDLDLPVGLVGQAGKTIIVKTNETGFELGTASGGGAVDSVNGQTGVVILDADDIDETASRIWFTTAEETKLGGIETGAEVNTIDTVSDTTEIDLAITARDLTATIRSGSIDESKLDTSVNASLDLADTAVQPAGLSGYELLSNKATDFSTINNTLYPTVQAVNTAINTAVTGLLDYRGSYDASTNLFPATGGSGILGAILKGDFWICSVAGTLGGVPVTAGDLIIAIIDTPGQTAGNWDLIENTLGYTPENVANKENTTIDTNTTKYPTVNLLKTGLDTKQATLVSGTNIKTVNSTTLLGSGDIAVATTAQGALADSALQPGDIASGTITARADDINFSGGSDGDVLTVQADGSLALEAAAGGGANTALSNLASVAINTTLVSDTDNTDALGTSAIAWSDLHLGSGGVIAFNSAPSTPDVTITHSADTLTFAGGTIALGTATATGGLTGNVTGNVSGTAATVTTAAQPAITSVGTLTVLDVDNIRIDGNTISSTAGTDLNITPLAGQQIVLDGTIEVDAGVVTGATSITSTTFVGALTGNASTATSATTAGVATTVTAADESSDTSCFPLFVTAATGNLGPKTASGLTFDSSTDVLSATGFAGPLTGNVTGNVTGSSGSTTGNAATATALQTTRAIYGNNFDGSAALTQVIASTYGGTGNGFTKISGPTTTEKTITIPDANMTITAAAATVLDDTTVGAMVDTLGGATSTGTGGIARATSPTFVTPLLGTPTSGVLTNCTGLTEAGQTIADNTTNDVSTTKHGYAPKGDGSTSKFLNANGAYSTPAASTLTSAVRAYLTTSAQTVSTGFASRATVQFNAESFDVDGEFSTSTYTFTPAATGKYQLNIHIGWNNWSSSDCELYLVIGGVESLVKTFLNTGSGAWTMDYSDLVTLTATSSTVLVKVAQYTGGNRNINTGEYVTNFSIKRVS